MAKKPMARGRRPLIGGTCPTEVNLQDEYDDDDGGDNDDYTAG